MTAPTDDLYDFLNLSADASAAAIGEAIAKTEKRLSGKHGLGLTELSRQRALLLNAKRWLLAEDRRQEYDRNRLSGQAKKEAPAPAKTTAAAAPAAAKARPAVASAPVAAPAATPAASVAAPPAPSANETRFANDTEEEDQEEESGAGSGFSLPILLGGLGAATVIAFAFSFAIVWVLGGGEGEKVEPPAPEVETEVAVAEDTSSASETEEPTATSVVRSSGKEIILTPPTAKLIGPNVRLDGAENPPRIKNWTSGDSLEWDFESPGVAIYQARLEYDMKPESEGNRYRVSVGNVSIDRTVGGGSYKDGSYHDVFFLRIPSQGLSQLRIEPIEAVAGGELMNFRSLTLAPRQ